MIGHRPAIGEIQPQGLLSAAIGSLASGAVDLMDKTNQCTSQGIAWRIVAPS
ncbi:hypothetical protein F9C07_8376 [Aspergillus flavus]|uniref:Uncharacterized protein n=1 Tax=Aspergillus flavus (strain ATCC 200026 / FGSC A1120 / IAM 13836 / NRRL 3357 / JCM 12722 / SRRC 167) TaxID=332952 RepID=A0A7U2N1P2_ASPFN|nr:hypothetical protein F9C07_8376 [Aspergillus flavus]